MRGDNVNDHSQADGGAHDPVPLHCEVTVVARKEREEVRKSHL